MIYLTLIDPKSSIASKKYAMKTLIHLSSAVSNKVFLVGYQRGVIVKELMRVVSATSSIDQQVKIAATEVLCSLICRSTASNLCQPDVLVTLASQGCGKEKTSVPSARVIKKLSSFIHSNDLSHEYLLQALVTLSYGIKTEVLKLTVKACAGKKYCVINFTEDWLYSLTFYS